VAARDRIAANVHLLMSDGPDAYERVLVTPTHVVLVRRSGIIDLVSHSDAEAQIRAGQPAIPRKIDVGVGPMGRTMFAEEGPGGTVRLYRQLPHAASGEIPSTGGFTSFALTEADAYHPFGAAGKTVTITIPRSMLERVKSGELGGTGWTGGGMGMDVIEEVQVDTGVLKKHLDAPSPAPQGAPPSGSKTP
jgi:hypothetical protein